MRLKLKIHQLLVCTVELFNASDLDNAIASTTTNEQGFYEFADLANGEYVVKETQPSGYESVTDIDNTDDNQIAATITDGNSTGNDFLEEVPVFKISGTVLEDTEDDDVFGSGDTPIEEVTIELFTADTDGNPVGSALETVVTDSSGNYEFTDLVNGNYAVVETQPEGFDSVRETDDVVDNKVIVTIDGGNREDISFLEQPGRFNLSGAVFKDTDTDSEISDGDINVEGVSLELYSSDESGNAVGEPLDSTTTNDTGFYEFVDLPNGNYVVVQVQPSDLDSVSDTDGGNDNRIVITIDNSDTSGHDFLERDRTFFALSGAVFEDADDTNDISDGDRGVPEVTIELFSSDADGNPTDERIDTATTNQDGFYQFTDLDRGNYVIVQTQPRNLDSISDSDGANDNRIFVSISDSDTSGNDFLEKNPPELYKLSGTVYEDTNAPDADGIDRDSDGTISNVPVELFNADDSGLPIGTAIASTTTDTNGFYEFTSLTNGNYVVVETQPAGFESVTDIDGVDDNRIAATIAGEDSIENDFLEETPIELHSLSGTVYEDTNAPDENAIERDSDGTISDVTIELFNADPEGMRIGEAIAITTTDDNGLYRFADLVDGNYVVVENQPSGYRSVTDVDGVDDNQIARTIAGTDSTENDFLEEKPPELFELSGRVFSDIARDDSFSDGDETIPAVRLELRNVDVNGEPIGEPIATTETDENGFYRFGNLANGNYVITQSQPRGYSSVTDVDGFDDNRILVQIDGANVPANNFLEVNLIEGTASPDTLIGTAIGETMSGYKGQDTLTGDGGSDRFVYTETSDGIDIITDFTPGEDQIDLSQIMSEELAYEGSDPIADGFVVIEGYDSVGTMIQIDFDNSGELFAKDVVFLDGVDAADINPDTDLIF